MRVRGFVASVLVLFLAGFALGCSKSEAPKPAAPPPAPAVSAAVEGKALFEQKCGVCHGMDRATVRKETKEIWMSIVKDMQGKKADWISDADAAKILEFLASEHGKK
jgi:mono/diheme cytochrome c family protein